MDKRILVTGASRGLGLDIARRLLDDGYIVIAASRNLSVGLESAIESSKSRMVYKKLDLSEPTTLQNFCRELYIETGSIYGLVNNAAIAHDGILSTQHDSQITEMIQVNVTSTILLTKYAMRHMLPQREGRIVNISSIVASTGYSGLAVYGASKAAMIGFTRSLSREAGRVGITVNAIAPGYMDTDMSANLSEEKRKSIIRRSPLGSFVCVSDVSAAVSFLMSGDASNITGTTITVDAGSTA